MLYLPLLIFVAVTVWIAGWREALEITATSLFICFLFGIGFGVILPLSVVPRIVLLVAAAALYARWRKRRQHVI